MRKGLWLVTSLLVMALLVVASVAGCQQQPQPVAIPSLVIMVESNIVEAGSSFMVSDLNVKTHQKIWIEWDFSQSNGVKSNYCPYIFDEEGLVYPIMEVPEDVVPVDYEVEVFMGEHFDDRELIATLPIHVRAVK